MDGRRCLTLGDDGVTPGVTIHGDASSPIRPGSLPLVDDIDAACNMPRTDVESLIVDRSGADSALIGGAIMHGALMTAVAGGASSDS